MGADLIVVEGELGNDVRFEAGGLLSAGMCCVVLAFCRNNMTRKDCGAGLYYGIRCHTYKEPFEMACEWKRGGQPSGISNRLEVPKSICSVGLAFLNARLFLPSPYSASFAWYVLCVLSYTIPLFKSQ